MFSSKLDSLRARSWDQHISPTDLANERRQQTADISWDNASQFYCQTDLSHRFYWRCSSFFWFANAVIPFVNHHYFAAGFCMIVAIDCLFWSLCAKTCRIVSQGIQLDIELSPQLVAVFNAKQVCKYFAVHGLHFVLRSSCAYDHRQITTPTCLASHILFQTFGCCFSCTCSRA